METKCQVSNKYEEIVNHLGYIFNEKPEAIRKALQSLNSFDELIVQCMTAQDMNISLEESLAEEKQDPVAVSVAKLRREEGKTDARAFYCQ